MTNLIKNEKFNKAVNISKCVFLCVFTVYLITREIVALNYFINNLFITGFFLGIAILFIGYDILTKRFCFKTRYFPAAVLFLLIAVLSCIINGEYGIFSNLKGLAALVIYLFLLYPEALKDNYNTTMKAVGYTSCFTMAFYTLVALPMYFYNVYYYVTDGSWQGFYPKYRFWGLYQEPSYASLYGMITICFSIILFAKTKSIFLKILLVLCDIIQMIYISFGGSRMAKVAIIVALIWISLVMVFKRLKFKVIYKILIFMLCIIVSVVAPLAIIKGINTTVPLIKRAWLKNGSAETYVEVHKVYDKLFELGHVNIDVASSEKIEIENYPFEDMSQTVDRDDRPTDLSNGRFERWIDGIKILLKTPLFGTSPRNIVSFAKDIVSDTLMGEKGYSIHNTYLEILTGAGIFGGIAILAFLIMAAVYVIKTAFKSASNITVTIYTVVILIIAFSALLLPDIIFFQTTFAGFSFWLCLGYCLNSDDKAYKNSFFYRIIRKMFKKERSL